MSLTRRLLPLASVLLLAACGRHPESASTPAPLPVAKVAVTVVRQEASPLWTEVVGSVRPVERATISSKVMGSIEEIPVVLGQRVQAGDLIARLSASEISARLLQAQAQLSMAKRDLDRERELLNKDASTADVVRNLEDRYAMMKALVKEAEAMLSYTQIRAPFNGVISRKSAYAGDLASPGVPLVELEGTDAFEIEAGIPESLANGLQVGMPLELSLSGSSENIRGSLREISSAADLSTRSIPVKIALPAQTKARSGQFCRIQVPGAPVSLLTVPSEAVSALGQMERVFVVSPDKHLQLRLVRTGRTRGGQTEILSGLNAGESIVAHPASTLVEGQPVETQP